MPPPQWREPTGLEQKWGFDGESIFPWFMVGYRSAKSINLDFADGLSVNSINRHIADIVDQGKDAQSRVFQIWGKSPGRTRIEVRDPITNALLATLAVNVKRAQKLKISFHFVEDKVGDKTIRQPDIIDGLIDGLNDIYEFQTNLTFETSSFDDIKVDVDLTNVILDKRSEETRISHKDRWNKVFARKRDRLADFNIYFVPIETPVNVNIGDFIYIDDNNCVIEDGFLGPDVVLPHAVGRMLSCPIITENRLRHHLMFWSPAFTRRGNFIPKQCANMMNP